MSRPMADTPKRRARRQFTDEFKAGAVRLVLDRPVGTLVPPREPRQGSELAEIEGQEFGDERGRAP